MTRYHLFVIALALALSACAFPSEMRSPRETTAAPATGPTSGTATMALQPALTQTAAATASLSLVDASPTPDRSTFPATPAPPAAAPSITPDEVQFRFGEGVAPAERAIMQKGMAVATTMLGGAGQVTVYANTDLDALAASAERFYGRSANSPASMSFHSAFLNGALAISDKGGIWIWVSDDWKQSSPDYRIHTMVHEYFHIVQAFLAKKALASTGPIWLYEGAADFAGFRALETIHSKTTPDQVHADRVTGSRGMASPLRSIISYKDTQPQDPFYPYYVGYLAVEYLTNKHAGGSLETLEKYWSAQAAGASWESASQQVFGIPLSEFYDEFEQYRAREFPPYCGNGGGSADQTAVGPLQVTLVRRAAPGEMFVLDAPWSAAPNIPYVFCVNGAQQADLFGPVVQLPPGSGWEAPCGDSCLTIYLKPTVAPGKFSFSIQLRDGRHADVSFDHRP